MRTDCDVGVIGAGPAGLTAGIYLARAGLSAVIIERMAPGGQMVMTDVVENYPGIREPVSGYQLAASMRSQAEAFGAELRTGEVTALAGGAQNLTIRVDQGDITCRAAIVATGAHHRKLGVPGEGGFWGRGVSCCATCDGMFYRGKDVVVIGGGDTAVKEAIFLTRLARKITIVHRRDRLRATKALQDKLFAAGAQVAMRFNSVAEEILGDKSVRAVRIRDVRSGKADSIDCDGVFIFVGFRPNTGFLKGTVDMDEDGYICTDDNMTTSNPGIFAAGDCRQKLLRQIVTACSEGATAAYAAEQVVAPVYCDGR